MYDETNYQAKPSFLPYLQKRYQDIHVHAITEDNEKTDFDDYSQRVVRVFDPVLHNEAFDLRHQFPFEAKYDILIRSAADKYIA